MLLVREPCCSQLFRVTIQSSLIHLIRKFVKFYGQDSRELPNFEIFKPKVRSHQLALSTCPLLFALCSQCTIFVE